LALHHACPKTEIVGLDPDRDALERARAKAVVAQAHIEFVSGFFSETELPWTANKIVSSLVLHQVPLETKKAMIGSIHAALPPGGAFHLADYAEQDSALMRAAFRLTVQLLDGREDTQPNADGVLEPLMREVGFDDSKTVRILTPTGAISLYQAEKRQSPMRG
jgi:ubiquinone/menaquinone biosynthesis C-methylase UbiE